MKCQPACMQAAVVDAGVKPEEVDYINAHGTSTHRNDLNETLAAKKGFWRACLIKWQLVPTSL